MCSYCGCEAEPVGVGVPGWPLARAVAMAGQLGVVSGVALDVLTARRHQLGDPGGTFATHLPPSLVSSPRSPAGTSGRSTRTRPVPWREVISWRHGSTNFPSLLNVRHQPLLHVPQSSSAPCDVGADLQAPQSPGLALAVEAVTT